MATDPFTLVHNALWALLEAHQGFVNLVPANNRIKFTGDLRAPIKDQISTADLPEVRIVPTGGEAHLKRTSNSSSVLKRWEIQVSTGDQRVDYTKGVFAVEWEILIALQDWITALKAITWTSKPFVVTAKPATVREGVTEADLNRGIKGWSALWACEVEMFFQTSDMAPVPVTP